VDFTSALILTEERLSLAACTPLQDRRACVAQRLRVEPLEAVDETPIVDLKPVWKSADH